MDDPCLTVPYHWELVEERDRGYETPCWVDVAPFDSYRHRRRLLHALVGETGRANGTCLMHLCEVYGEPNRCIRPEHVRVATMSENVRHSYALRRAAGQPRRLSAEHRAKIAASMVGKPSRNAAGKNQWNK